METFAVFLLSPLSESRFLKAKNISVDSGRLCCKTSVLVKT